LARLNESAFLQIIIARAEQVATAVDAFLLIFYIPPNGASKTAELDADQGLGNSFFKLMTSVAVSPEDIYHPKILPLTTFDSQPSRALWCIFSDEFHTHYAPRSESLGVCWRGFSVFFSARCGGKFEMVTELRIINMIATTHFSPRPSNCASRFSPSHDNLNAGFGRRLLPLYNTFSSAHSPKNTIGN
jgi:hypothetical protein